MLLTTITILPQQFERCKLYEVFLPEPPPTPSGSVHARLFTNILFFNVCSDTLLTFTTDSKRKEIYVRYASDADGVIIVKQNFMVKMLSVLMYWSRESVTICML